MLHVDAIKATGAKVVFGVDATDLKKCREVKEGREWDKVAFNFPHVGMYTSLTLIKRVLTNTFTFNRCWNYRSR